MLVKSVLKIISQGGEVIVIKGSHAAKIMSDNNILVSIWSREDFMQLSEAERGAAMEVGELCRTSRFMQKEVMEPLKVKQGVLASAIMGQEMNKPVDFLLVWTVDGKSLYNTGTCIEIGRGAGIPVFNLFDEDWRDQVRAWKGQEAKEPTPQKIEKVEVAKEVPVEETTLYTRGVAGKEEVGIFYVIKQGDHAVTTGKVYLEGTFSPTEASYHAAIRGMKIAHNRGYRISCLATEAQGVVNNLLGKSNPQKKVLELYKELYDMVASLDCNAQKITKANMNKMLNN